jgi:tetratricopeptide (TPR) repeat protein
VQQHKVDMAAADFEAALACRQLCIAALDNFCDLYAAANNYAGEIPKLDALIRKYPDNALFINRRGIAFMYNGDAAKAVADFDFVLAKAPAEASAYFHKALCLEKLGDLGNAAINYRQSMRFGTPKSDEYAYAKTRIGELSR